MEESITVLASIRYAVRKEKDETNRRRISRRQMFAQGSLDILKIISGTLDKQYQTNLACRFTKGIPLWFRKGLIVQAKGVIEPLTKKSVLFTIEDILVISERALRATMNRLGVDPQQIREHIVNADGGFSLAQNPKEATSLAPLYEQDSMHIYQTLTSGGLNYDMEVAYRVKDFMSRRARVRNYESVGEMIAKTPLILADMDEFSLQDLKKAVKNLGISLPLEVELYAEISSTVYQQCRNGHAYAPLRYLALRLQPTLTKLGIDRKKQSYFIATIGNTSINQMPSNSLAKLTTSGRDEIPNSKEAIQSYYYDAYVQCGFAQKAKFWSSAATTGIYLSRAYFSEVQAAKLLCERCGKSLMPEILQAADSLTGLDQAQKAAIKNALTYMVSVITGGAGTGKTHTVKELVALIKQFGHKAIILAPSAMAAVGAARKAEWQLDYKTIHRFARILPEDEDLGETAGERDYAVDIPHTFLIIDESAMCDLPTFATLLHSVKENTQLRMILLGDPDQLSALGPGFFKQVADGLLGDTLPVTKLETNWRSTSDIVTFANALRQGMYLTDISTIEEHPLNMNELQTIAQKLHDQGIDFQELLFLTPTVHGEFGTKALNKILRSIFLTDDAEAIPDTNFYIGDPVITIKNDYADNRAKWGILRKYRHPERKDDVYNGTRGKIISYRENTVIVRMQMPEGEQDVPYSVNEIAAWIDVAYAITVHKAQGSEADIVVFTQSKKSQRISRNMLYTAVTRARDKVYLIGTDWEQAALKPDPPPFTKFAFRFLHEQSKVSLKQVDSKEIEW